MQTECLFTFKVTGNRPYRSTCLAADVGTCPGVARASCSPLDLESWGLHMWFSPSMTLAKRQRENNTFANGRMYFNYVLLASISAFMNSFKTECET
jgi:hypothetical protein